MDTPTLARAITAGRRILGPNPEPVPLVDLPPLDLPPLRTHETYLREHGFWPWLAWVNQHHITDDELRRFRRRERDRARRARA